MSGGSSPERPGTVHEENIPSAIAVAGHPLHAMSVHFPITLAISTFGADIFLWWSGDPFWTRVGLWTSGFAFVTGIAAGLAGTAELLLVPQLRNRVQSWRHGVSAMMLIALLGLNWGVRWKSGDDVLVHGLVLSALGAAFTGLAGWHGGKLIFHHGVGVMVSSGEEKG
jgi:uncharacterized membrane protein